MRSCGVCNYPNHARQQTREVEQNVRTRRRYQFTIRLLFVWTTIAAIVFSMSKAWGFEGFYERLVLAAEVSSPIVVLWGFLRRFERKYRDA